MSLSSVAKCCALAPGASSVEAQRDVHKADGRVAVDGQRAAEAQHAGGGDRGALDRDIARRLGVSR